MLRPAGARCGSGLFGRGGHGTLALPAVAHAVPGWVMRRIGQYRDVLSRDGTRIAEKMDFEVTEAPQCGSGRS